MQKPQTSEKGAYRVGYSHLACNLHFKKKYMRTSKETGKEVIIPFTWVINLKLKTQAKVSALFETPQKSCFSF